MIECDHHAGFRSVESCLGSFETDYYGPEIDAEPTHNVGVVCERSIFRVHPAKLIVMTTPIRDTSMGTEIAVVRDFLDALQRADISAAMALVTHACN